MSNFTSPVIMQNKWWLSHYNSIKVDVAEVVERRGCDVEGLGSNLGGFLLLSTGCTSGTKRPRVIVIFEASDVTRVCPYRGFPSCFSTREFR